MKLYFENTLQETSTSRLVKRFQDDSTFAIISAYTGENQSENRKQQARLKNYIGPKYGFNEFESTWVDEDGRSFEERALLIPNITLNDAFKLAVEYDQYTFIYKDLEGCREIASKNTDNHKPWDIVRTYNTSDKNFMNIDFAKSVFAKRLHGAASKPMKGGNRQPFTLKEVLQPRPSYFHGYEFIIIELS